MKCIYCKSTQTRASDTRSLKDKNIIKRRRECLICKKRFTTYEKAISPFGQERR